MNAWEEKILDRQEAYEEGHSAGHAEGLNEGALQEKRNIAKNLKKSGIPVAVIAENTGLTEREDKILTIYVPKIFSSFYLALHSFVFLTMAFIICLHLTPSGFTKIKQA